MSEHRRYPGQNREHAREELPFGRQVEARLISNDFITLSDTNHHELVRIHASVLRQILVDLGYVNPPPDIASVEATPEASAGIAEHPAPTPVWQHAGPPPEEMQLRALIHKLRPGEPTDIEPFTTQATERPWGHEILVAHAPGLYTGKVLKRYAGGDWHRAGLQYHVRKDETFYLFSGEVVVYFVDPAGELRRYQMHPGAAFHVPPGAIHSVETLTDSVMFEASTPVFDDRVRVEHLYDVREAKGWTPS